MNSYQNQYEILESSSNNTNIRNRYPFANDRNMSPMSWNDCQGRSWQDAWESASDIVTIGTYLIQFLLEPGIGGIPVLLSIINKLIPSSGQSVSSLSICDLLSIIRKEVADSVLYDGVADFNGKLTNYKEYYLPTLKTWLEAGQPVDNRLTNVVREFRDAEKAFNDILAGSLSRQNAQILLLPTFAQAASVQLLLLRDAEKYKEKWGALLRAEKIGSELISPTNIYEGRLKEKIAQYTNHCVYWYQTGLNQIKEAGTSAENWLKFNKFRREMTLAVLDIIAIFPTYDFENYPIQTKVELSRIIYTDPVGWTVKGMSTLYPWYSPYNRVTFNQLEAEAIRSPYLSTWLDSIDIYSSQYSLIKVWSGNANTMKTIGGVTGRQDGSAVGNPQRINIGNTDIFKVELTAGVHHFFIDYTNPNPLRSYGIINSKFFMTNGSTPTYTGSVGSMFTQTGKVIALPGEKSEVPTADDYTHRLSDVINLTGGFPQHGSNSVRSSLVAHGWTHKSLNRENIIEANQISQIPAVKAFALESGASVSTGPGHTGGDVVSLSLSGRLKIRLTPASTNKNYRVRIRYATSYGASLMVQRWSPSGSESGYFSSSPTGSYTTFGYLNTLVTTFNQSGVEIIIENRHYSNIIIDKIEFIPENTTILESEGEQNLEKAQNVVNDLFIN